MVEGDEDEEEEFDRRRDSARGTAMAARKSGEGLGRAPKRRLCKRVRIVGLSDIVTVSVSG